MSKHNADWYISMFYNPEDKLNFIASRIEALFSNSSHSEIVQMIQDESESIPDYVFNLWMRFFADAATAEHHFGKDLSFFKIDEVKWMYMNTKHSRGLVQYINSARLFSSYTIFKKKLESTTFSKENIYDRLLNFKPNSISFFDKIYSELELERPSLKYFSSISQFYDIVLPYIQNDQDLAIFICLFYGIKGNHASEISNLTINDVDFKRNLVNVKRNNRIKKIEIPQDKIQVFEDAYYQSEYASYGRAGVTFPLATRSQTSFIMKSRASTGSTHLVPISKVAIFQRVKQVGTAVCADLLIKKEDCFSVDSIYMSGIAIRVLDLYKQNPKMSLSEAVERVRISDDLSQSKSKRIFSIIEYLNKRDGVLK